MKREPFLNTHMCYHYYQLKIKLYIVKNNILLKNLSKKNIFYKKHCKKYQTYTKIKLLQSHGKMYTINIL